MCDEWTSLDGWDDGDSATSDGERAIDCAEAVVIRAKQHVGHAWAPRHGRVYFGQEHVASALDVGRLAPGAAVRVVAELNQPIYRHGDASPLPDIKWRATLLEPLGRRAAVVREGAGVLSRSAHGAFGFIDSADFARKLFVPGFAAANNFAASTTYQLPQLDGQSVHFLAIPNPKQKFQNLFVIALHPFVERVCGGCIGDNEHWLQQTPSSSASDLSAADDDARLEGLRRNDLLACVEESISGFPAVATSQRLARRSSSDVFECVDCAFAMVTDSGGYLWSPMFGKICFEVTALRGTGLVPPASAIAPGLAASASLVEMPSSRFMAVSVRPDCVRSANVLEGFGSFVKGLACGVVFADDDGASCMLVPAWALAHFEAVSARPNDVLNDVRVHYVAIQKPQRGLSPRRACVVALHPALADCSTTPATSFGKHWTTREPTQPLDECSVARAAHVADREDIASSARDDAEDRSDTNTTLAYADEDWNDELAWSEAGDEPPMETSDAYFTYIRPAVGYLRSPTHGTIVFDQRHLRGVASGGGVAASGRPQLGQLSPGTRARVIAVPLKPSCRSPTRPNVHAPVWRALAVYVDPTRPERAADVLEGFGSLTRVRRTYGILSADAGADSLFVPGWAGVNNVPDGWQIPQLASSPLHFLAMPNPKRRYHGEPFVLAAHPRSQLCTANSDAHHWLLSATQKCRISYSSVSGSALTHGQVSAAVNPQTQAADDGGAVMSKAAIKDVLIEAMIQLPTSQFQLLLDNCGQLFNWAYLESAPRPSAAILRRELAVLSDVCRC